MFVVSAHGMSDVGQNREQNEDAFLCDDDARLYVVSDGMGGHNAGEVASEMTIEAIRERVAIARQRGIESERDDRVRTQVLQSAVEDACGTVYAAAKASKHVSGMGATATAVWISERGASIAHVGDSRAYLLRDGAIHQLTDDHTIADELFRNGALSSDELENHPARHALTRAIGQSTTVHVDILTLDLFPGDKILLCSDGLSNYAPVPEVLVDHLVAKPRTAAKRLVDFANNSGGSDNITALVIAIGRSNNSTTEMMATTAALREELSALARSSLFEGMSMPSLIRLHAIARRRNLITGEILIDQDDDCHSAFVVVKGQLERVFNDQVLNTLDAPRASGLNHLLAPRAIPVTLRASEASSVLIFDRQPLRRLAHAKPQLGVGLYERIATRVTKLLYESTQR